MKKTLYDYKEAIKQLSLKSKYTKDELLKDEFLVDKFEIIKDLNKFNKTFVEEQFNLFMEYIKEIYRGVPEVAHSEGS